MRNKKEANGIKAMHDEGYELPISNEKKLQKTEFAWWSSPAFIIFLTISMSILDALVLYDILDQAMTQAEYMGKIVSFGIALVLNMLPLLIAKYTHQAIYKIKRHAAIWAVIATVAFSSLFISTVYLRFAYQDLYGESSSYHITNELEMEENADTETTNDTKGTAVVVLLSIEPLVTSIVNFLLAYISDDELRERINCLRLRKYELREMETDLKAYIATTETSDFRRETLLRLDEERKVVAIDEIHERCNILKAQARVYLAEYLADPVGASYVTASFDSGKKEVTHA